MDCATKTIKHCKICHTSFFPEVSNVDTKALKYFRLFINKLQVRTKASMSLPATPGHVAEGGRAAVLPSGFARVMACSCPLN